MNIVKGVADLIRRTSTGQSAESGLGLHSERFFPPTPKIRFSEVGDEAILNTLWGRYENALDKAEKKKLFHIFLKQFLIIYKNWEPVDLGQSPEVVSSAAPPAEYSQRFDDVVLGCHAGHPAEIILALTEEVKNITASVTELKVSSLQPTADQLGTSMGLAITSEGLPVLDALSIVTRSIHNCRVLGHYGGIQKLAALLKAAVVQLKTITCALSADESLSNSVAEKSGILQRMLVHVVLTISSFINLRSDVYEKSQLYGNSLEFSVPMGSVTSREPSSGTKAPHSETRLCWHQKAVVLVMEAGGLNWLVELLRVMRRLNMKEQWTDILLPYLSLRTLLSALADNPRGQNHFRSIGGLEVLLDGLGVSPNKALGPKNFSCSDKERDEDPLLGIFQLHVLSLEVLREAVFGNLNNLQFLCENGRVHKFANSFCSPAFILQEYKQKGTNLSMQDDSKMFLSDTRDITSIDIHDTETSGPFSYSKYWKNHVVNLSRVLSSFLLPSEDIETHVRPSAGRSALPVSSVYGELSIKWVMRVLHTVFPCIKACSNQDDLPSHVRIFIYTLQHYVLFTFRKVLVLFPSLLGVFRAEGVWDFVFSENFFYFGSASAEYFGEYCTYSEVPGLNVGNCSDSNGADSQLIAKETDSLQIEVVSFVEFAATLNGSSHNVPECSVLLDALEQCACNPEIVSLLAKSLLCILQLSAEKTVSSFKTLDAVPRVLKVACIQAQESRRRGNISSYVESNNLPAVPPQNYEKSNSPDTAQSCYKSMETSVELFAEFFSVTDDAKYLVLHSSTCIDSLFDLFWEEGLRNRVLAYILNLMKIIPFSEEDQKAKLYICSNYLETFTHVKEREKKFAELSVDLLVGMRDMLLTDQLYYQALFRDGECFLHIVSLLNGNPDDANSEKLVLNVLQTLTFLLAGNDASKAAFRALVGKGYQTLQSLLLDFCQQWPTEELLNALLDMLVDGKFDLKSGPVIKNEDVILLYLRVLQKSSDSLQHYGLGVFLQLQRDSISNRASCVRAGMLNFLLDWFSQEDNDSVFLKIGQLIQVTGGHSISGKDIRKIFALLRSEKVGNRHQSSSLLLASILSMLNEKGPTAFFDLNGSDSILDLSESGMLSRFTALYSLKSPMSMSIVLDCGGLFEGKAFFILENMWLLAEGFTVKVLASWDVYMVD
ncbi:unnamed protein product [Ilex paraguariensis]|uniref:Neurobeachin alpha-solenoid region domain-containing protein n=1 Tax=Ilex paraguariensis TaxID=185542 RepID=A0ABC8UZZ7_9AQUA